MMNNRLAGQIEHVINTVDGILASSFTSFDTSMTDLKIQELDDQL